MPQALTPSNSLEAADCTIGSGKLGCDFKNLTLSSKGGLVDKFYNPKDWKTGFGAHFIIGNSNLKDEYLHEIHHLWHSRSLNDVYLLNYALHGLDALLMRGEFLNDYNYYEELDFNDYWR